MSLPLLMTGHDRTYTPPRSLRGQIGTSLTAWDLFRLEHDELAGKWAAATLESVVAAVEAETGSALGCTDCLDTGFYGVADRENPDLLLRLVRRSDTGPHEVLQADGSWENWSPTSALEVLDQDTAADLAAAVTAGASGLLRLYGQPRAFLPPIDSVEPVLSAAVLDTPQLTSGDDWSTFAVVHDSDPGAVLDLYRFRADEAQRWDEAGWTPDVPSWGDQQVPMVQLTDRQLEDVLAQLQPNLTADAPLTVSPDPRAERLRRYWSSGRGAAKIRWLTPGDWKRCYRHLVKYMGLRAKGYCQNLHKRNTGVWTGSRFNVGGNGHRGHLFSGGTPEQLLLAALRSGRVTGDTERTNAMPTPLLTDGVYTAVDDTPDPLLQSLAASAIPVQPPDEWFTDPGLDKVTSLTVTDEGRVYGHLAPWGVTHIGMIGDVRAPKNRTGQYPFFRTGQLVTASGANVRVGQLTLAGGHASRTASAEEAVKHYDDTQSAVADVVVGEDKHGIWAAGALRPTVTPEQVRVMRASPPSGDWRRINGNLELVAACHVNVQGFPIAEAVVAGGAISCLVAAGVREMAQLQLAAQSESAVVDRLAELERVVASLATTPGVVEDSNGQQHTGVIPVSEDNPAAAETQDPEYSPEELARADRIAKTRQEIADAKRETLRQRVKGTAGSAVTAGTVPPQFLAHQKAAGGGKGKSTIQGTDSFPIGNVGDLKKAIQAFGRAGDKAAAKKHIISMAYKLKRPDLIPAGWRNSQ